jgi:hypothetical protein
VGASLQIMAVDSGITQEQRTNGNGYYRFPGLPIGRYSVTIVGSRYTGFPVENTPGPVWHKVKKGALLEVRLNRERPQHGWRSRSEESEHHLQQPRCSGTSPKECFPDVQVQEDPDRAPLSQSFWSEDDKAGTASPASPPD